MAATAGSVFNKHGLLHVRLQWDCTYESTLNLLNTLHM